MASCPARSPMPIRNGDRHELRGRGSSASRLGYRCVASARGDVQALCRLIRAELDEGADMLHPGAVDTAGDLEALLEHRFRVRKLSSTPVHMSLLSLPSAFSARGPGI